MLSCGDKNQSVEASINAFFMEGNFPCVKMLMQIYEMLQFDHNVEAVEHGSYFKNLKC